MCTMPCSLRGLVEPEVLAVLQERLADAGHVAVAEDADRASEEGLSFAVALDALGGEEPHNGLADCDPLAGVGTGHYVSFLGDEEKWLVGERQPRPSG